MNTVKCICMECQTVFRAEFCKSLECPACESPEVEPAEDCPKCGGAMRPGDRLCRSCRKALLARVTDFFDTLTYEEETQFDEWMDGNSITDRRHWERGEEA